VVLAAGRGFDDVDATLTWLGVGNEPDESWDLSLSPKGEFRLEDLAAGDYLLEITKPRYDPYFYQFSLDEDESIFLEAELQPYSIPSEIWEVLVVADFLDWDPLKALPMSDDDGDGLWETATPLPIGRYSYKYIINGLPVWFVDIDSRQYEPDGFGYYNSVVELEEAQLVAFRLDTNDTWFRREIFELPPSEIETGYVLWEPEEPRRGQEIFILYDPQGGPLEGAEKIVLHWGVNDWTVPLTVPPGTVEYADGKAVETPMEPDEEGLWWAVIPTDGEVSQVDFVFTGQGQWDNNGGQDWHVEVR
jgi:hypothetical protein